MRCGVPAMNDKPQAAAIGSRRVQFIASVKLALRHFDEGRSPTECLRDIRRAVSVMEKK